MMLMTMRRESNTCKEKTCYQRHTNEEIASFLLLLLSYSAPFSPNSVVHCSNRSSSLAATVALVLPRTLAKSSAPMSGTLSSSLERSNKLARMQPQEGQMVLGLTGLVERLGGQREQGGSSMTGDHCVNICPGA
jgi:hypothetical protein